MWAGNTLARVRKCAGSSESWLSVAYVRHSSLTYKLLINQNELVLLIIMFVWIITGNLSNYTNYRQTPIIHYTCGPKLYRPIWLWAEIDMGRNCYGPKCPVTFPPRHYPPNLFASIFNPGRFGLIPYEETTRGGNGLGGGGDIPDSSVLRGCWTYSIAKGTVFCHWARHFILFLVCRGSIQETSWHHSKLLEHAIKSKNFEIEPVSLEQDTLFSLLSCFHPGMRMQEYSKV